VPPLLDRSDLLVHAYLDALNAGDRDAMREVITTHFAPSFLARFPSELYLNVLVGMQMGFYYATAGQGYKLCGDPRAGAEGNEVRALLYNKLTASWADLCFPLAPDPPHKIGGMVKLDPANPPPGAQSPRAMDDVEIVARLDTCLESMVRDDEFSGAVLLARDGEPLFERACGLASKSYAVPNRIDTKFNMASLGKMFTGVAVAQLAEQNVLSFDDQVSKYLPSDWLKSEIAGQIQIRHLLTHTSGLGDYFQALYRQPASTAYRALDDYKPLIAGQGLAFEPGTQWSYSNAGMLLLGVIIEQVTGQSYFDCLREHVYAPAGMADTDAYEKDSPVHNRATGYSKGRVGGQTIWRSNLVSPVVKGSPSGGSYTTVRDLLRFAAALRTHKLLSPAYTETVLSAKPEVNSPFYGYGFFVDRGSAGRIASHGGDGRGVNSQFRIYLDLGYTVAVLANYDPPAANVVHGVCQAMLDAKQPA
jgi:CubicO group peptidase (beta-lactamase class C family)